LRTPTSRARLVERPTARIMKLIQAMASTKSAMPARMVEYMGFEVGSKPGDSSTFRWMSVMGCSCSVTMSLSPSG
jgi:hypothetical protein